MQSQRTSSGQTHGPETVEARRLLGLAATQGHAGAQAAEAALGGIYLDGDGWPRGLPEQGGWTGSVLTPQF